MSWGCRGCGIINANHSLFLSSLFSVLYFYLFYFSKINVILSFYPYILRLHRMTSIEREEKEKVKKKEKKQEEEETMQQATWVKYTFPVKHQVIFIIII